VFTIAILSICIFAVLGIATVSIACCIKKSQDNIALEFAYIPKEEKQQMLNGLLLFHHEISAHHIHYNNDIATMATVNSESSLYQGNPIFSRVSKLMINWRNTFLNIIFAICSSYMLLLVGVYCVEHKQYRAHMDSTSTTVLHENNMWEYAISNANSLCQL
jgi:predicted PurR-regulated permease PerM